ncbi:hypothetical protein ACLOJK_032300 [Asimina triloba]
MVVDVTDLRRATRWQIRADQKNCDNVMISTPASSSSSTKATTTNPTPSSLTSCQQTHCLRGFDWLIGAVQQNGNKAVITNLSLFPCILFIKHDSHDDEPYSIFPN